MKNSSFSPSRPHSHSHSSYSEKDSDWNLLRTPSPPPPRTLVKTWLFSRIRALTRRGRGRRRSSPRGRRRSQGTTAKLMIWFLVLVLVCFVVLIGVVLVVGGVVALEGGGGYDGSSMGHYVGLMERCSEGGAEVVDGCANLRGERVFIASVLGRAGVVDGVWGERVSRLVGMLGRENVFVSVYGGIGGEEGREALERLRGKLKLEPERCSIVFEEEGGASLEGFENVTLPDGSSRTKWTSWHAEMRNRALRPLDTFKKGEGLEGGVDTGVFDKVLFLDDVAFEPIDAAQLLFSTNLQASGKARYLAACALVYSSPFQLDSRSVYSLRDSLGYTNAQRIFPYFSARPAGVFTPSPRSSSREEMLARSDAVGVKSCWGGMVAVQGRYLQNLEAGRDSYQFVDKYAVDVRGKPPARAKKPVRFRYETGGYYDADEGCLFAADLADVVDSEWEEEGVDEGDDASSPPLQSQIFVNPYVRVATHESVLSRLDMGRKFERLLVPIFTIRSWFVSGPSVPHVDVQHDDCFDEEIWDGDRWRVIEERRGRVGMFCGRRGMRVLKTGGERGKSVELKIPPGWDVVERRKEWYRRRWDWWWFSLLGGEEKGRELPKDWRRAWEDLRRGDRAEFWELDSEQ